MTPVAVPREPGPPRGTAAQLLTAELLRRFPLRVGAHVRLTAAPDALRVPLVADLLGRASELLGGQTLVAFIGPGRDDDRWAGFLQRVSVIDVHPPVAYGSVQQVAEEVGRPAAVQVADDTAALTAGATGTETRILVAPVLRADADTDTSAGRADHPGPGEPLAVRLALLSRKYDQPVALADTAVDAARRTLARWRAAMAAWAEEPSAALPPTTLHRARTAMADLDTPALLALLARTETDGTPGGAKFETFAYLDRVLGVGLATDLR
ncbi:hypothetical protein [Kitasatospora sp. NPDC047058]|uniref:hypothetical protein n=1 Tax=Kitasatospora sp. NPDC047058 TaxID=3155620 RepID=UPI0033D4E9C4